MGALTLDHVIIAVRDLEAATQDYAALLGRAPSWRGAHPKWGTANTLFRIDNTYIELLALAGKAKGNLAGELGRFLERGEGVYGLALGTTDMDADVQEARRRGLEVMDPVEGSGTDEKTGATRTWRNAFMPVKATHGVRLFLIQHTSPPEALPVAEPTSERGYVQRMDHAVVLSVDMERSKHLWADTLGCRLALDRTFPERDTRILFFRLGDITVEMSGGAQQTEEGMGKPDRLWGLAWGVDDMDAACKRLTAAGVSASDSRRGIKPGTRVATVKGPHAHGVATLLIEHAPESFAPESRLPQGRAFDAAPEQRAFRLTGLDHVALAVKDTAATAQTWLQTLGLKTSQAIDADNGRMRLTQVPAGNGFVELAEPLDGEHRVARWIDDRGPGMLSLAVQVDDVDAAVADLRAKGVTVSDPAYGAWPGTRVARIDRAAANGVAITLVQRLPDVM